MAQIPPFHPLMFQIPPFVTLTHPFSTLIFPNVEEPPPPIHRLPDEIFEQILSDAVDVPDTLFRQPSTSLHAVLDPNFWQSSCILEVHSHWRRVGVPLVYNTVMLNSEAQSQALQVALKSHPEYRSSVKNFRINGPWTNLGVVLSMCTEIRVLYMALNIYHWDSVDGLCQGILMLNPVEVVCNLEEKRKNANLRRVITAVVEAIPKWENLTTFTLPNYLCTMLPENTALINALASCPSMRHIYAQNPVFWPAAWSPFAQNPMISLHISNKWSNDLSKMLQEIPLKLEGRVHLFKNPWIEQPPERTVSVPPPEPISIQPLLDQPVDVQCGILSHIFEYLIMPGMMTCPGKGNKEQKIPICSLVSMRKNLLQTCAAFQFFVTPLSYNVPLFTSREDFFDFVTHVQQQPHLGFFIEKLTLQFAEFQLDLIDDTDSHEVNEGLCNLFSLVHPIPGITRGLRRFNAKSVPLSLHTLITLAGVASNTLVSLRVRHVASPEAFKVLCGPGLGYYTDTRTLPMFGTTVYPLPYFPHVKRLHFSLYNIKAIELFTHMMWPSLNVLIITGSASNMSYEISVFLNLHGANLVELEINGDNDATAYNFCPNLRVLRLTGRDHVLRPGFFQNFTYHPKLEHIVVHEYVSDYFLRKQSEFRDPNLKREFFEELDFRQFPRMRTLELKNYSWPNTIRDVAEAIMPKYFKKLALQGPPKKIVKIIDKAGRAWRQRVPRRW